MARSPKVSGEIPDINADWNWLGKPMPVKDSSLQRSAWQAQDGRIAFIFTNVSDNEIGFSWDFKSSDYFKGTKKIEINTFDGRRKPVENTFNNFINIAPQKIVVYIVSQCE